MLNFQFKERYIHFSMRREIIANTGWMLENNLNLTKLIIRKSRGTIYQDSKWENYHA